MNKSVLTNLVALSFIMAGYYLPQTTLFTIGLFAFSGALTNWLAIHMLFEKVPGLYGSGIIPARFEAFKSAIKNIMMTQFFTNENIDTFLTNQQGIQSHLKLDNVIEKVDLTPAFDSLVKVIMESSFGGMLGMFGGQEAITPLKEPFIEHMKKALIDISNQDDFIQLLQSEIEQPDVMADIKAQIVSIIDNRLTELTPQLVKQIVQQIIKEHLGWLVVWGGIFGGLIGFISTLLMTH